MNFKVCVFSSCLSCCGLFALQVEPFASLAGAVRNSVPRLLINRDLVGPFAWRRRPHDVVQLGDVVTGVQALVDALGWTRDLDALMATKARKVRESLYIGSVSENYFTKQMYRSPYYNLQAAAETDE